MALQAAGALHTWAAGTLHTATAWLQGSGRGGGRAELSTVSHTMVLGQGGAGKGGTARSRFDPVAVPGLSILTTHPPTPFNLPKALSPPSRPALSTPFPRVW